MGRVLVVCLPLCLLLAPTYPGNLFAPVELPASHEGDKNTPLPHADPVVFLQKCRERYDREVKGYTLTFVKREFIRGVLNDKERIAVHFRDQPHSVFFDWQEGARLAARVVYVQGENDGKMLVRAKFGGLIVTRDPDGEEAKQSGRLRIDEFGLKKGLERVLARVTAARDNKTLHLEYRGVKKIDEVGERNCYVLKRSKYAKPEDDGVTELELYIDTETWLLVGTVSKGTVKTTDGSELRDQLIAAYYFRDIKLNPQFKADQFQRTALSR